MTAEICVLRLWERVRQDAGPVQAMYQDMGTGAADQVIARVLGELALTTAHMAARVVAHDLGDLARQLRRVERMAEQLGLVSFASVAGDARQMLARGDATAFAAIWARLLRVAERTLAPDHDLMDQSV
ncbi:hypothetical protein [Neogemmobacter tilapiae]|nr:hypothetical protein [Gemmobacter tilapiae]